MMDRIGTMLDEAYKPIVGLFLRAKYAREAQKRRKMPETEIFEMNRRELQASKERLEALRPSTWDRAHEAARHLQRQYRTRDLDAEVLAKLQQD